jgi:polyribonucleotide nucleotidyltransferase
MPLTTEYRLRFSAAGRIPGNYDRRESRPSEFETLTSRLIDRSVRPFFPGSWCYDTQVLVTPLSYDPGTDPGVLGISAAAAALCVSDIPWGGPVAGVRVGRVDGELALFPAPEQLERSDLDLVVSVGLDGIVMLEGGCDEVTEPVLLEALLLVRRAAAPVLELLQKLREAGRPKRPHSAPEPDAGLRERVTALAEQPLREALEVEEKLERYKAVAACKDRVLEQLEAAAEAELDPTARAGVAEILDQLKKKIIRAGVVEGRRIGGRGPTDIRPISGRAGWLKRCHGSSLFTRGETQAVVTCTLGTQRDAKNIETLDGNQVDRFLLHYNFPPYSVGEVRPLRGPGRREIGHGHLARRALLPAIPSQDEAPYTIRVESLITESNGSSSMATVCGGSLALLDAGVKLKRPVAGIAMGLVKEGERLVVLSDILGDEDHVGDMDFKVCGTSEGVTAIQLDNKLGALPDEVMQQALEQARSGRLHILERMAGIRSGAREDLSPHAPRVASLQIETNRIGTLVGPGGKTIRGLEAEFGVSVVVDEAGRVSIYGTGAETIKRVLERVKFLAGIPRLGEVYDGVVVGVQPYGSFVRLFEGIDGLLADQQLPVNQRVKVKVSGVNPRGRLVLERAES